MLFPLIFFVVFLFSLPIIDALVNVTIFGRYLSEAKLDAYYGKNFDQINQVIGRKNHILSFHQENGFSAIAPSLLSRWYISNIGQVPRWSKWSKRLDKKRIELLTSQS